MDPEKRAREKAEQCWADVKLGTVDPVILIARTIAAAIREAEARAFEEAARIAETLHSHLMATGRTQMTHRMIYGQQVAARIRSRAGGGS